MISLQPVFLTVMRQFFKNAIVTDPASVVRQPVWLSSALFGCAPLSELSLVVAVLVVAIGIRRG